MSREATLEKKRIRERARYAAGLTTLRTPEYRRQAALRYKYGLSPADYDAMLAAQNGGCALCGKEEWSQRFGRLHVDHDHETGRVRGLLCAHCNRALGILGDTTTKLEGVVAYMKGIL